MSKLQCAVIGCGRIGCSFDDNPIKNTIQTHSSFYNYNKKTDLVSLCDIDQKLVKKYSDKYNLKNNYTNIQSMLENENLDCLSICTRANSHLETVKIASKFNIKGIIIEKPISDSLLHVKKIIKLCEDNNIILAINHQRRFDPFYHELSDKIKNGLIGDIENVTLYYGGGISNTGSHIFDILRLFFGEVDTIQSNLIAKKSKNPQDPNLDLLIKFKNKIQCNMISLPLKNYGLMEMDIFGNLGRLKIDMVLNTVKYYTKKQFFKNFTGLTSQKISSIKTNSAMDISKSMNNFILSVLGNNKPLCTGQDGYYSLEMIVASLLSYRQKKIIHLPIKNTGFKIHSN
tara:strand:+ start:10511 stop:11539 length:1029 start_codon:yes stop_codon:yes gene_type:complete